MAKRRRRLKKSALYTLIALALLVTCGIGWAIFGRGGKDPNNDKPTGGMATPEAPVIEVSPGTDDPKDPQTTPTPETQGQEQKASIFLAGDALLHESVYTDAQQENGGFDFNSQLELLFQVARPYDLQYFNQESLIGGTELGLSGYPEFNSPKEFAEYMLANGFNLVSTANNHCLDKGEEGIVSALNWYYAKKGQMIMQGINGSQEEYDAIATGEVNGITYAFLSYCEQTNGREAPHPYTVNYYPGHEQEMLDKIKRADSMADVVIVAMYWGTETPHDVSEAQLTLADQMTEAGADIIVGNDTNALEPFRWVNGRPVFFAMGNLISTQVEAENRIGIIAGIDIVKRTKQDGTTEIAYENVRADLAYTYAEGEYPELRTNIKVYPFSALNDELLPNYQELYEQYKAIITKLDTDIKIGGV
ncbi:MAG: CapA family protein [Solobacterium sp.]|nr:CapA family protein [Solobacterium sp.]